jgi:hypothetical protein
VPCHGSQLLLGTCPRVSHRGRGGHCIPAVQYSHQILFRLSCCTKGLSPSGPTLPCRLSLPLAIRSDWIAIRSFHRSSLLSEDISHSSHGHPVAQPIHTTSAPISNSGTTISVGSLYNCRNFICKLPIITFRFVEILIQGLYFPHRHSYGIG